MSKKLDRTKIANSLLDKRVKLQPEQKAEIVLLYKTGDISINQLARNYQVSKRLIHFILFPERHKLNLELRAERGGSKQYYDTEKNTIKQREHRKYKRMLLDNNLIKSE